MSLTLIPSLWLAGSIAVTGGQNPDKPLPDPQQLRERARASMKRSEKDRENYSCIVNASEDQLDAEGSIKHRKSRVLERFFINGIEIEHVLSRDGKELTGADARKEQERVDKGVKKYGNSREADKLRAQEGKQVDIFLRALRFTNGRRMLRDGRSVVIYDLVGDPSFHPHKVEERFAQALSGRIWMDEDSGQPLEVRIQTDRDVKIGGGLLANLHKGFQLHLLQQRQPDSVWLTKIVEGSGDAKTALFFHPRFRFREELENCHLFSVTTQQKVHAPPAQLSAPK
jgi:hypothetical protein